MTKAAIGLGFVFFSLAFHLCESKIKIFDLTFPKEFLIGTATSAYQVEGAWRASGKGESIWDYYVHRYPKRIADNSTGDKSTNFYNKYEDDIKLLKEIGFNHFRFSISWPRIFPTGYATNPNQDGIQYYHNILDELEKNGIIPFVTIYHWDHPQNLEKLGGWLNEDMAQHFSDYAKFIFQEFGHRVKYFSTINEPYVYCKSGYGSTDYAPGANMTLMGEYLCIQNMLKGHALAYHIYDKEFRRQQRGKVGIVIPCINFYNKYENDPEAAEIAYEFQCGCMAHPIFSRRGDYPEIVKQRVSERSRLQGFERSRFPTLSREWIKKIRGSADYFGLNHYTSQLVESLPLNQQLDWPNDEGLIYSVDPRWKSAQSDWLKVVPQGLGDLLRLIKEKYHNPPVYILENGVSDANGTNDNLRIEYLYTYMKEMLIAMKRDRCDVQVYTIWSFLDSFEWNQGYQDDFGLVKVDFQDKNRRRIPKKSVSWLKRVLESRELLLPENY